MRCNSQANKPINYLMNVKCCFSERLEAAAQLHFLPQKYKNLEKTKQNYLLNIQIMGWEKQVKIIGKPISLSLERGAHKADSESLFLFSAMSLDCCGTLLPKAGHCFKFNSQFSSTRTFQSLNFSCVSDLWMGTKAGTWAQVLEQWAPSPAAVLESLWDPRTSLMCHCTSPDVCESHCSEMANQHNRGGEQQNHNSGIWQNQLVI